MLCTLGAFISSRDLSRSDATIAVFALSRLLRTNLVMMSQLERGSSKMRTYVTYMLGGIVWVFAFILAVGCSFEAFLLVRYPGLDDPSSGPAHYWPEDAFQIIGTVCFVVFVFFCISFMIYKTQKSNIP